MKRTQSKKMSLLGIATALLSLVHKAVVTGDLDEIVICLPVIRETARRCGRFAELLKVQDALNAVEARLTQHLADAGRSTRLH